ncbi:hypothetical protein Q1695_002083 [Nippostrongylus brasiliensis]|nr:hypothetical protein Q1695_002083 [Nippostrongylus brasiliensis]
MADPVADFLAREQDILAEIDGAPVPAVNAAPPAVNDEIGAMVIGPPSVGGGDSGVDLAGMDFQPTPPVPLVNGNGFNSHHSAASSKGASPVPSVPRIEAENIRRWREQQKVLLEKKDEAEEKKKNELREAAKKELEDWYKQRDAALKLTKEANRKAEQEHLAAFGREQGEGAQWDEIARLCEAKAQQKGGGRRRRSEGYLTMEERLNEPSSEELLELIEKQELVMECLAEKLEITSEQTRLLREAEEKRRSTELEVNSIVAAAQQKVTEALASADLLQNHNDKLQKELEELKNKAAEEKPVASVIHLRNRVKELEFELVRGQRAMSNLQNDYDFLKGRLEQTQAELETCNTAKQNIASSLSSKLEDAVKELSALRVQYQSVVDEREHIASELGGDLEVQRQRSSHLQVHCERLSSEVVKLRKECKVSECRIAALVEENAALRARMNKGSTEDFESASMQKLLKDQNHLIAALREEGRLLVDQLEVERKEHRAKFKLLKKEKQELEDRLQKVLSI